jgi:High potential iron-sulfur protein
MNNRNRRTFMLQVVATSSVLAAVRAHGQTAGPKLEESDPQAAALGYKQDTTKVDGQKYPKHEAAQTCAVCQLFQGKPKDAAGGCLLFAGKQVAGNGWCSAWAKKAA